GRRTRLVSARRQLIQHMNPTMPASRSPSSAIVMAPAANISWSTSTSVVSRETMRPTGVASKKRIGNPRTRVRSATRRSPRLRCARHVRSRRDLAIVPEQTKPGARCTTVGRVPILAPVRVVIVGAAGQLGRELTRILPHDDLVSLTRADLDLQDAAAVTARLVALAPAAVVNAAADNRVDAAEEDPTQAVAVNALGVAAVARACRSSGAFFVQPSTDYVFDGRTTTPYTEEARPNPLGMYARS